MNEKKEKQFVRRAAKASVLVVAALAAQAASASILYAFGDAGASGASGPTQSQVNSAYQGTSLAGQVTALSTGIQQWTVATSGMYSITGSGASGGYAPDAAGGKGASITIEKFLTAGHVMQVLVGLEGGRAAFNTVHYGAGWAGGGGGGTFIYDVTMNELILAAGGGGGAAQGAGYATAALAGVDASLYNNTSGADGTSSYDSWSVVGTGGTDGNGGDKPGYGGAAGGGYYGNGTDTYGIGYYYGGVSGASFINGGLGGANIMHCGQLSEDVAGGFGGGAGAGLCDSYEVNAGGGGGYSGGGGGNTRIGAGGGGGNFISGVFQSAGFNVGNGSALFSLQQAPNAVPEPGTIALMGFGLLALAASRRRSKQ